MNGQNLFSEKKKKKKSITNLSNAELAQGVVNVNYFQDLFEICMDGQSNYFLKRKNI